MNASFTQYIDILEAAEVYKRGENVTLFLKDKYRNKVSLSDIIEVAYDLQSGSYIKNVLSNRESAMSYWKEVSALLSEHVSRKDVLLDVGAGELTTLSGTLALLKNKPAQSFAFDISWSRLMRGLSYVSKYYPTLHESLSCFCANIDAIPLPSSSVDLVISNHALEPNREQQDALVGELVRVAKRRLVLLEPCYEINSDEGKKRMDLHDYIRDLDSSIAKAGGRLTDKIPLKNVSNPLNPTVCYVVDLDKQCTPNKVAFTMPGTDFLLREDDAWLVCDRVGVSFPILQGLPILRKKNGVISTAISNV